MNTKGGKKIALLGATGSIGTSTLKLLRANPCGYEIVLATAQSNAEKLAEIVQEFHVPHAVITDGKKLDSLRAAVPQSVKAYGGEQAMYDLLRSLDIDIVLCAISGNSAIESVRVSLEAGHDLALANKEALVCAGPLVMKLAAEKGAGILPVDSEHSAIFQCLANRVSAPEKIILTASGGPFLHSPDNLSTVTAGQALAHPVWNMGRKVTLDSATLMNKALEMIEAARLFRVSSGQIDVLIHPQSIVHSLVQWSDGNMEAVLSVPDMQFPIAYALSHPARLKTALPRLNLAETGKLTFEKPDEKRFPSLGLARAALDAGGSYPLALSEANEVAGNRFFAGEIAFTDIWRLISDTMDAHKSTELTWDILPQVLADVHKFATDWRK